MAAKRIWTFDEVDEKLKLGLCLICDKPTCQAHENVRFIFLQNEEAEAEPENEEEDEELKQDGLVLSSATSSFVPEISRAEDTKKSLVGEDIVSDSVSNLHQAIREEDSVSIVHQTIKEEPIVDVVLEPVDEQPANDVVAFSSRSCYNFILGDLRYEFKMFASTTMVPTLSQKVFPPPEPPDRRLLTASTVEQLPQPNNMSLSPPPEPPDVIAAPTPFLKLSSPHSLIDFYSKYCCSNYAHHMFDEMPEQDVASWIASTQGWVVPGNGCEVVEFFCDTKILGIKPIDSTVTHCIKACPMFLDVKEIGVYHVGCFGIATKFDQHWKLERKRPCWSHFLQTQRRAQVCSIEEQEMGKALLTTILISGISGIHISSLLAFLNQNTGNFEVVLEVYDTAFDNKPYKCHHHPYDLSNVSSLVVIAVASSVAISFVLVFKLPTFIILTIVILVVIIKLNGWSQAYIETIIFVLMKHSHFYKWKTTVLENVLACSWLNALSQYDILAWKLCTMPIIVSFHSLTKGSLLTSQHTELGVNDLDPWYDFLIVVLPESRQAIRTLVCDHLFAPMLYNSICILYYGSKDRVGTTDWVPFPCSFGLWPRIMGFESHKSKTLYLIVLGLNVGVLVEAKSDMEIVVVVEILARVRHNNFICLHGYYAEGQEQIVVNDYRSNLSTLSQLHRPHLVDCIWALACMKNISELADPRLNGNYVVQSQVTIIWPFSEYFWKGIIGIRIQLHDFINYGEFEFDHLNPCDACKFFNVKLQFLMSRILSDCNAWIILELWEVLHYDILKKERGTKLKVPYIVHTLFHVFRLKLFTIPMLVAAPSSSKQYRLILKQFAFVVICHRKMIYTGSVLALRTLLKWKTLPLKHDTCEYSPLRTRMF